MSEYEGIKRKIRKQIAQPENQFRGITEATGLRILDGVYLIAELLQQQNSDGADSEEVR